MIKIFMCLREFKIHDNQRKKTKVLQKLLETWFSHSSPRQRQILEQEFEKNREKMACLKVLKEEIRSLEAIFPKNHSRLQIISASVDELTCRFIGWNSWPKYSYKKET